MPEHESTSTPLAPTRESWHRVAEHVLSATLKRATGRIALRPGTGGVRTPPLDDEGRVLAIVGTDVALLVGGEVSRRAPLTTVREAAEAVGVEAGFPWTTYPPGTPFRPDEPLTVDPDAARTLAQWFALGDRALTLFAAEVGAAGDAVPQVYPEHFDLAISVDRVNYGASPGPSVQSHSSTTSGGSVPATSTPRPPDSPLHRTAPSPRRVTFTGLG
jgi:hypothetical protein